MLLFTYKRLAQLLPAIIVCLGFLSFGIIPSWTSPVLSKLEADDSHIPITRDEASWIVSVLGLGGVVAPAIGIISDRLGRRPMLILTTIPLVVHWIMILLTTSPGVIIAARFISSIGITSLYVVGPVYVGEIAQEDFRGVLGTMTDVFYNLGSLFSYSVGPYTAYTVFNSICCIFPVVFMLLMFFMPESPYHLMKRNKRDHALLALMRLRYDTAQGVKEELGKIEKAVKEQNQNKGTIRDIFIHKESRRGLLVTVVLVLIQQSSGMMAIAAYSEQIFQQAPEITLTSSQCSIVVGVIQVISGSVTVTLVDKVGRRPLLMLSALSCGFAHCILGTYFFFHDQGFNVTGLEWIPLTSLILFEIFFCLGLSSLPILMLGEVFPSNVKDLAVSISVLVTALSALLFTKMFQVMADELGSYSPFWLFSAALICGFVFIFFVVPETKGKRFETIIADLNGELKSDTIK